MRQPSTPMRRRAGLFAAVVISLLAAVDTRAVAEDPFARLFVFGDSYTDVTLAGVAATTQPATPLKLWRVYPLPLQEDLGIDQIVPFGVGGARASPIGPPATVNPPGWHLQQQVDAYLANGNLIGPRDLVTLNIGGNDGLALLGNILTPANNTVIGYPGISIGVGNAATFANITADFATAQIERLVASGARNFVLGEFSGLSGLPIVPSVVAPIADAYGQAYFNAMQARLAPLAQDGVRFFMFDLFRLGRAVSADPARFGFIGFNCPGPPPVCGGDIASPQQKQFYLGPDGLHLTSGGFALVADYMANIVLAPDTIAVQPAITAAATSNFTGAVLGRLDALRERNTISELRGGLKDVGYGGPATRPDTSRFTVYTIGTFASANHPDAPNLAGFDSDAGSGTAGIEYRAGPGLIVGLAGNYTSTDADLDRRASIDVDAAQVAGYLSYASRRWFADALIGYGHHDLDLSRPGVIDIIRSDTEANVFAAVARGGYLFDVGPLRAGPIAGLTYTHSKLDGYTEKGDPLLTYSVAAQTLETLTGSFGVQLRAPFMVGQTPVSTFLNVTLEHEFGDATRTMTATLTQAPLVPILSPVANFDTRTYGKVEGGLAFELGPQLSATVNAASTFARDDNDYRVSVGLNYRF
ncbi:MAG TPA: autotransporter domain-containing protein [Hyphomicrobiaceae bacterium]|nr:autotransporter domain-containing protein [Hyphomicrobiaceae bacterium]